MPSSCSSCHTALGRVRDEGDVKDYFVDSVECACGTLKFCKHADCRKDPRLMEAHGSYFCDKCLMKDHRHGTCTVKGCKFPLFDRKGEGGIPQRSKGPTSSASMATSTESQKDGGIGILAHPWSIGITRMESNTTKTKQIPRPACLPTPSTTSLSHSRPSSPARWGAQRWEPLSCSGKASMRCSWRRAALARAAHAGARARARGRAAASAKARSRWCRRAAEGCRLNHPLNHGSIDVPTE
jgi:hypothetical protein